MIETGATVGRHHDHVDILLIGHLDDILERPAKLDDRAYLDQIDTVGKTVAEKLSQDAPVILQQRVIGPEMRTSLRPFVAQIDDMINDHLGAAIARHLQGVAYTSLGQLGEIRRRQNSFYLRHKNLLLRIAI